MVSWTVFPHRAWTLPDVIAMTELTDMSDVNASTHLSELDTSDDILKLPALGWNTDHETNGGYVACRYFSSASSCRTQS